MNNPVGNDLTILEVGGTDVVVISVLAEEGVEPA
jgi:hypothetical protein